MADVAPAHLDWTRSQTLAALHIYMQLPFGRLHRGNPKIKQLAEWLGRTPSSIAMKLTNLASLDPLIVASGRAGLRRASTLDRSIWAELQQDWDAVALEAATTYEHLASSRGITADADLLENTPPLQEGRTRSATVQVRVNQARFRAAVLISYNATCCISGLRHEKLVIASHIVPWSEDRKNQLNPQNGLCLSALHDRAYDQGLITVMPDFKVRVSNQLKCNGSDTFIAESLLRFDNQSIHLPERFQPSPEFLASHARRFGFMR